MRRTSSHAAFGSRWWMAHITPGLNSSGVSGVGSGKTQSPRSHGAIFPQGPVRYRHSPPCAARIRSRVTAGKSALCMRSGAWLAGVTWQANRTSDPIGSPSGVRKNSPCTRLSTGPS